jgi:hypothetical protein
LFILEWPIRKFVILLSPFLKPGTDCGKIRMSRCIILCFARNAQTWKIIIVEIFWRWMKNYNCWDFLKVNEKL